MTRPPSIGVVDWGIGGLEALTRLSRAYPARYVYHSDSGFAPYGTVPAHALVARLQQVVDALRVRHELDGVVVACNAASVVLPDMRVQIPIWGVLEPGVAMLFDAVQAGAQRVGVIGGRGTIASGTHACMLRERCVVDVVSVVAQPLSADVEAGRLSGPEVEAHVEYVCDALCAHGPIDVLLLGCTHYPALTPLFRKRMPNVSLLNPVDRLLLDIDTSVFGQRLAEVSLQNARSTWVVETTGDPVAMRMHAHRAFGVTLQEVARVPMMPCG